MIGPQPNHGDGRRGGSLGALQLAELQTAHDLFAASLDAADAGRIALDRDAYAAVAGALHLACWLLGHPGSATPDTMTELAELLIAAGREGAPLRLDWRP